MFLVTLGITICAVPVIAQEPTVSKNLVDDLSSQGTSLVALMVLLAPPIYTVTDFIKLLLSAFLYERLEYKKDPFWFQALFRILPMGLGALMGMLVQWTVYFSAPWGVLTGMISGIFCTVLYQQVKSSLSNLKDMKPANPLFSNKDQPEKPLS